MVPPLVPKLLPIPDEAVPSRRDRCQHHAEIIRVQGAGNTASGRFPRHCVAIFPPRPSWPPAPDPLGFALWTLSCGSIPDRIGEFMMGAKTTIREADPGLLAERLRQDLCSHLQPGELICIPTGRSPERFYTALAEDQTSIDLWRQLRFLQLDEYIAPPAGTISFRETLQQQVYDPLGVPTEQIHTIDSTANPAQEVERLELLVARLGPPRTAILGLGSNGHIAFNEPCDHPLPGYHKVSLSQETLNDNFSDPVPDQLQAITIGLDLLKVSRRIYLLVPQAKKSQILDRCLQGPYDPQIPGTCLHDHPDLHIYRS